MQDQPLKIVSVGAVIIDELDRDQMPLIMQHGKYEPNKLVRFNGGSLTEAWKVKRFWDKLNRKTSVVIGGSAGNLGLSASIFFQRNNIPAEVVVVSKFGTGENSQKAIHDINTLGGHTSDAIEGEDFNIPWNFVISSDDRWIYVNGTPYPDIAPGYEKKLRKIIQNADLVHIHTRIPDLAILAAAIAHEEGKPIIVDASGYDETLDYVIERSTYAFLPDELEINGQKGKPEDIMDYIMSFDTVQHGAVLCGAEPTLYKSRHGNGIWIPVSTSSEYKLVDKLAAGDVTRAGILTEVARQISSRGEIHDVHRAIEYGMSHGTYSAAFEGQEWHNHYSPQDVVRLTSYELNTAFEQDYAYA